MKTALIFSRQRDHIQQHDDWAMAPPMMQGQMEYSLMPVDALVVLGINSPPLMETSKNVSEQFTIFAIRA